MGQVSITLPDGSMKSYESGVTPLAIANSIGKRLSEAAIVAKVDGQLTDLSRPIEKDASVAILTEKNSEALEVYRHSSAHLLALAVTTLFPETQLGIGPPVENGFYYDFYRPNAFTQEDLEKIEQKMLEFIQQDLPFKRTLHDKNEGLEWFRKQGAELKCELIQEKVDKQFSCYTVGTLVDFCLGPHVPSTGRIKAVKLLSIAGAYWKGDEHNKQLQRIYGTAFFSKKELDDYLKQLEEAKKRDHRRIGKELDLFSLQEEAGPGLVFWHPKGALIRTEIEDFWRTEHLSGGYDFVCTPHIAKLDLWRTSGHVDFYRDSMYAPMKIDETDYQLKPMNCPFHILIYKNDLRSYRDLPLRWAETGTVYRYERSGVLAGLFRVRGFTQDDAHIFCTPDQIENEVVDCLQFAIDTLNTYGFNEYEAELSTWDGGASGKYAGSAEQWQLAEKALQRAADKLNLKVQVSPDEAAFYGPKIDVKLVDAIGRKWQLSTVQFDFNLPARFDLEYIGEDGKAHQPVMVHRALYGSIERFFGILIEHYAGAFPVWLAPVQAIVLPITDRQLEYARCVQQQLDAAGIRATVDDRSEKVNLKIRDAQLRKVPFMLVIGEREVEMNTVAVRDRVKGDTGAVPVAEFSARLREVVKLKG